MGEVTPEVVDGLINAYAWADPWIHTLGPGVAFATVAAIAWRALKRADRYIDRVLRNAAERSRARREQQQNLDTCNAILHATRNREEKPQP